jgi:hypothetical protein
MELLKYINSNPKKRYSLRYIYDKRIAIKFNNKEDFIEFMKEASYNNTVRTFIAGAVWNKYVAGDIDRGYNGMIAINVDRNDEEDCYEYMIDFGYVKYYEGLHDNGEEYIIIEYKDIEITDWSMD